MNEAISVSRRGLYDAIEGLVGSRRRGSEANAGAVMAGDRGSALNTSTSRLCSEEHRCALYPLADRHGPTPVRRYLNRPRCAGRERDDAERQREASLHGFVLANRTNVCKWAIADVRRRKGRMSAGGGERTFGNLRHRVEVQRKHNSDQRCHQCDHRHYRS